MKQSLTIVGSMGFLVSSLLAAGGNPPSPVKAASVQMESLQLRVRVNGQVASRSMTQVSPRVDGYAIKVNVNEGDMVKKDQVLALIDDREVQLQQKALQATLAENEADLAKWEKLTQLQKAEWGDLKKAEEQLAGSVSRSNLRMAEKSAVESEGMLNNLRAKNKNIKAQLEQVALQLQYHQLCAPFDGQVLDKKFAEGTWLRRGEPVLLLINTQDLEARLDIPESLMAVSNETMADALVFSSASDQAIKTENGIKSQRVDPLSRSFSWVTKIAKGTQNISQGSSLYAQIATSEKEDVLWVPTDAILKNDAGAYVYKVMNGPNGQMVLPMPVQIRYRAGTKAILQNGALQKGDLVVIEGNERLFPMTPVQVLGE